MSGVTGPFAATSARPEAPIQLRPSAQRIATDTPGIASSRSEVSVAWRASAGRIAG